MWPQERLTWEPYAVGMSFMLVAIVVALFYLGDQQRRTADALERIAAQMEHAAH